MSGRSVPRDLEQQLRAQGVHVPKYTAPDAGTRVQRQELAPRVGLPRAEVAQIDRAYPTFPAAPFTWFQLLLAEELIWTSDKPWTAIDVFANLPAGNPIQFVIRIYGLVGHTRTLMASGRADTNVLTGALNHQEWVASATADVERWEVTLQAFIMTVGAPPLSSVRDRLRFSVVAYGQEPGGERGSLGGISLLRPAEDLEGVSPQYSISQALIGRDRVRLIHMVAHNYGADPVYMLLQNNADATALAGTIIYVIYLPVLATASLAPPPGVRELVFLDGLVWRAYDDPTGTNHIAGAEVAATFHVR